jgi:hypothetical protein
VTMTTSHAITPILGFRCPASRCDTGPMLPGRIRGTTARAVVGLATRAGDVGDGAAQVCCLRRLGRRGRSSACRALWRAMKASRTSRMVVRSASSRKAVVVDDEDLLIQVYAESML